MYMVLLLVDIYLILFSHQVPYILKYNLDEMNTLHHKAIQSNMNWIENDVKIVEHYLKEKKNV